MVDNKKCFVCGSNASVQLVMDPVKYFYDCPVCGRYEYYVMFAELTEFNLNHLGAYLAYNGFKHNFNEYRYFTTMSKEQCDEYKKEFKNGNISHGHPVRLENENVENWYPKSFAEKVDYILLYLNSKNPYWGESIILEKEEMSSCLFVDRYELKNGKWERRADEALLNQAYYMLRCLAEQKFIELPGTWNGSEYNRPIILTPTGYARIDMLQKNSSNGKNVLVAMKFGEDTKILREAIRQGIHEAGYIAILIDEVEHNDFITPELLKYIRDSKFVVVDLSHQNNGAYFEEGYAMGLGKPVIQLCKKDVRLHFDIAQKNTIIWETEEEIPERLKNRIKATID